MPPPDEIIIVVVTDEHYIILLAALLKSIEQNHITGEKIHVFIVEDEVKKSSRKKLKDSIDEDMFVLSWLKMADAMLAGAKLPIDHTSFPLNIYMRLFIQNIVPAGTQKALFLDVDTIVLEDISKLWNTYLDQHVMAAVQDPRLLTFDNHWGGIFNYKELGFAPDTKYFNTGLLLIDIPKWTEQKLTQRVIDCVNNNIKYANYPDQYGLNVVLANQWLQLDSHWNYFASGNVENPFLIHFIARKPIYKSYNNNPYYQQLFKNYLKLTKWGNLKPIGKLRFYKKKIKNILIKIKKKTLDGW